MAVPDSTKIPEQRGCTQYIMQSTTNGPGQNWWSGKIDADHKIYIHYFYYRGYYYSGGDKYNVVEKFFEEPVELYFVTDSSTVWTQFYLNGVKYGDGWDTWWNGYSQTSICIASFNTLPTISTFSYTTMAPLDPFYQLIINKMSLDTYESITPNRFEFYIIEDGVKYLQTKNKVNVLDSSNTYIQYPSAKAIYDAVSGSYQARDATYTKY